MRSWLRTCRVMRMSEDTEYILRVRIDGMRCASCVNHIESSLQKNGASRVNINISRKFGTVEYEGDEAMAALFLDTIKEAGYEPVKLSLEARQ